MIASKKPAMQRERFPTYIFWAKTCNRVKTNDEGRCLQRWQRERDAVSGLPLTPLHICGLSCESADILESENLRRKLSRSGIATHHQCPGFDQVVRREPTV